ncbi:MAG TPA: PEP-CTERM sorting domain-containing protein [Anaerohalosphaeraceae bacterium]|jgi:hypothetical protein|nr:PEP-CTERM sorting domain-containing protein [Anaerohalosphaeraceae bacterium]HRT51783.1 PEP-CTERM sorting domain-containing protein [Anaerohalosphaeraceae bacterium]
MIKRLVRLVLFACSVWPAYAAYDDGLISRGEYEWYVEWFSDTLVVDGGGANVMEARNFSRIEVQSTSSPLGTGVGGIMDLVLGGYSRLDYYDGETEELTIGQNAKAYLYGGRIDAISNAQNANFPRIFIYAQEGWSWTYEAGKIRGITGSWYDGTNLNIRFNPYWEDEYPPAWKNIQVITPEPATLLLMALGGMLLRRGH